MGLPIFSAGHLNEHIKGHSSHKKYYSHKLKRLVSIFIKIRYTVDLMLLFVLNLWILHYNLF